MKITRLVLLLLAYVVTLPAFAQFDPRALDASDKIPHPVLLVPPKFPTQEPTDKLPVEVRMKGSVNETGVLESPLFSPADGNEKFIRAVEEVVGLWRFRPAIGNDSCLPVRSEIAIAVWFEQKNGAPSVSVSVPVNNKANDAKDVAKPREFVWRPKVEYPVSARRLKMEGATDLVFKVNQQGEVLHTHMLYSTPYKIFGEVAIEGSKRVTFAAGTAGADPQKTTCIVLPFKFCLTVPAEYPNSACAGLNQFRKL